MSGEWAAAQSMALQTLNGASSSAGRAGAKAAFVQVRLPFGASEPIIGESLLTLDESEAWLAREVSGGFEGLVSFACMTGGHADHVRMLIAQAVDAGNDVRLQLSLPMRRTLTGKYKPVDGSAELEVLESIS